MKNNILTPKTTLLLFLVAALALPLNSTFAQSDSWASRAATITKGAKTQSQKSRAIYNWICGNIAYDTEKKINTAEDCWENHKGVCQAYADLYVSLASAAGLEARTVKGNSAQNELKLSKKATSKKLEPHNWVIVKVEKGEILIDPTWGAGYVSSKDHTFHFNTNHDEWYDVDPYWMIFSHFPDKKEDQLIAQPIELKRFKNLPTLYPYLGLYGLDGKQIYDLCQERQRPPIFYDNYAYRPWTKVRLTNVPKNRTMIAGQTYTFEIEKLDPSTSLSIVSSKHDSVLEATPWLHTGKHYTIHVTPTSADTISLNIGGSHAISYIVELAGFSVSERQTIYFAPGNLRYDIRSKKYVFQQHQYDQPSSRSGKVEFFRWGTGENPTLDNADIANYASFSDWGANVKPGKWRTLTILEWRYLLTKREGAKEKVALASVCGRHGLLLLPDEWSTPKSCTFTPGFRRGYLTNVYNLKQWEDMEKIGAIFLPAVGNLTPDGKEWGRYSYGRYWTATPEDDKKTAGALIFGSDVISTGSDTRNYGLPVRLVKERPSSSAPAASSTQSPKTQQPKPSTNR